MRHDIGWLRGLALAGIAAAGLAGIVGSGGGDVDAPECSFFSNTCNPVVGPVPAIPAASIEPQRATVQAGASVAFTAQTVGIDQPAYQWRRSADGGNTYVDIPGATAASHTLGSAQLADDAAVFRLDVHGSGGASAFALSRLAVSSMPGIVFQDGEFQPAGWLVAAVADPVQNGPTHSEERVASGGNPNAYRRMVHAMPAGTSSLNVFHASQAASYDPAALGAIHAIDYAEDCSRPSTSTFTAVTSSLLLEQGGRRYFSTASRSCSSSAWSVAALSSLAAADFTLVDGPACTAGESCPDFSAGAAALRFGFGRRSVASASSAAGSIEHGIDNWQVTVWRR